MKAANLNKAEYVETFEGSVFAEISQTQAGSISAKMLRANVRAGTNKRWVSGIFPLWQT